MFVPMEEMAIQRRNDDLKRAELHRLARAAQAHRPDTRLPRVEGIGRVLSKIGKGFRPGVTKPITE
jgi:hypothetical protein